MHYEKQEFVDFLSATPPWTSEASNWWRAQPFSRKMAEDIVELHTQIEKHKCKSEFVPGIIVGFSAAVGLGVYFAWKDGKLPRKKNTP